MRTCDPSVAVRKNKKKELEKRDISKVSDSATGGSQLMANILAGFPITSHTCERQGTALLHRALSQPSACVVLTLEVSKGLGQRTQPSGLQRVP